jgi:hypothetical protein
VTFQVKAAHVVLNKGVFMNEYEIINDSSVITTDTRIQAFWDAQAEWSQATFGLDTERDHVGALKHLAKEAVEAQVRPADHIEIADCLFLTFDAARRAGLTLTKLIETAEQKLVVNKARKWNKPTTDEPVEHVRD